MLCVCVCVYVCVHMCVCEPVCVCVCVCNCVKSASGPIFFFEVEFAVIVDSTRAPERSTDTY